MGNKELKIGALISYLQMGLGIIIGLIYTPIMIRLLGQSEYGLYSTVASTISLLSILRLGFNNSYIRYYSKYKAREDEHKIFQLNGVFLLIFIGIGLLSLFCGIFITNHLHYVFSTGLTENEYAIARVLMILLTINLAISFPMSVFSNIISANEKYIFLKSLDAIKTVLGPMVTLPLLLAGYGSIALVAVTLVISLAVDTVFVYYVLRKLKNRFIFSIPERGMLSDLCAFTFFIALELIVDQVNWNIDKLLLARFKGTAAVAIYTVGFSLYAYYQQFSTAVSGVFTPRIHRIVNTISSPTEQRKALTELFTKVGRIQFMILSLIATGIILFGRFFITRIWAGEAYGDSYVVALLLILPATIALIQNLGIEIQRAEYRHQFRSMLYFFMAALNLGLSVILCKQYGAIGSAIGTAVALVIANGLIMNIYYHKKCNIDIIYFWKEILSLLLSVLPPFVMAICIKTFVRSESVFVFAVEILIYSILFVLSLWQFGMKQYERDMFVNILHRLKNKS